MKNALTASLASQDSLALFDSVARMPAFLGHLPFSVGSGHKEVEPQEWTSIRNTDNGGIAFWDDYAQQLGFKPKSDLVTVELQNSFAAIEQGINLVASLPFEVAAMGTFFRKAWVEADYPRWGFGRSHLSHGWGCAFRGAGHDRLVSRRWLDFGPWRVIRRPNDTTFIQFHDLAITDPVAAYAQAAPGHERMGNSATGGYLQHQLDWIIDDDIRGIYLEKTHTLEAVVAPAIKVSQEDMLSMCALRLQHRVTPPPTDRIDHIAYIFMERADAVAHLHELWLRELECWYVDGSGKHRLDLDYHPVPNPPAWVRALDDK